MAPEQKEMERRIVPKKVLHLHILYFMFWNEPMTLTQTVDGLELNHLSKNCDPLVASLESARAPLPVAKEEEKRSFSTTSVGTTSYLLRTPEHPFIIPLTPSFTPTLGIARSLLKQGGNK
ncbi:unnamed protein product [Acanthoscelides obtectus]|uniref:Uncharacterized protein n=1 Tax=Acanthoscelides obtectus TaxID=200917 RepID=A0A9P0Q725_ACAOB|nr:unnamed protein product [Acanthoscelides obtectus]CAK1688736.1 hypothetical protein AOBTE_LOCUS36844 [Acanthoscelides obtectus]